MTTSTPTLSILIATINRPTLARTLTSCVGVDEVILIADGPNASGAKNVLKQSGLPGRCITLPYHYNDWGHTPRNIGMGYCSMQWIAHMDDDDYYLPNAIDTIKKAIKDAKYIPHFFKVDMKHIGRVIWDKPILLPGYITTDCIVHPNDKRWSIWLPNSDGGDYHFAAGLLNEYGHIAWIDKVIACSETKGWGR